MWFYARLIAYNAGSRATRENLYNFMRILQIYGELYPIVSTGTQYPPRRCFHRDVAERVISNASIADISSLFLLETL